MRLLEIWHSKLNLWIQVFFSCCYSNSVPMLTFPPLQVRLLAARSLVSWNKPSSVAPGAASDNSIRWFFIFYCLHKENSSATVRFFFFWSSNGLPGSRVPATQATISTVQWWNSVEHFPSTVSLKWLTSSKLQKVTVLFFPLLLYLCHQSNCQVLKGGLVFDLLLFVLPLCCVVALIKLNTISISFQWLPTERGRRQPWANTASLGKSRRSCSRDLSNFSSCFIPGQRCCSPKLKQHVQQQGSQLHQQHAKFNFQPKSRESE